MSKTTKQDNPTPSGELDDQIAKLINDTVDDLESCWKENDQLREQLDAAVEALKLVRKALCSGGGLREATDIIDDALAKIKEKISDQPKQPIDGHGNKQGKARGEKKRGNYS